MPEKTRAPLVFQLRVNAPPQAVFDAFFRHPTRWLCRQAEIELATSGHLRLSWADACVEGRFVQLQPPTTARLSWHLQDDPLPPTMVVVTSLPADDGRRTDLEVEHYGFGAGPNWDPLYLSATRAWAGYLKNLRAVLEAGLDLREADE